MRIFTEQQEMKRLRKGKIMLVLALMCINFGNVIAQQRATYNIDLRQGSLVFQSNKEVYQGSTRLCTHESSNAYVITTNGVNTDNTITIETVNLVPNGASNQNMTYDITFDNVYIDRFNVADVNFYYANVPSIREYYVAGRRTPFNAGDNTVNVNLTLKGTNIINGETGPDAMIQYNNYDGGGNWSGTTGTGKLTIQAVGNGSLSLTKKATINSGPCIGSAMCGYLNFNTETGQVENISNGDIVIKSGTIEAKFYIWNTFINDTPFASAIGGAACNRCGNITIEGGSVIAHSYNTASVIGGGGGEGGIGGAVTGTILIKNNAAVTTYSEGFLDPDVDLTETGVGIGAGSSRHNGAGGVNLIKIEGGTVIVKKKDRISGQWVDGNIGGGNSNMTDAGNGLNNNSNGGYTSGGGASVIITGGTITAANIGGGAATYESCDGGNGYVEINMVNGGELHLSGSIGGGNATGNGGNGGNAEVYIIQGTLIVAGGIGGGDATNGTGGTAHVEISGGTLNCASIGGGDATTGTGGNASIYITGGTLDCASIGGGDAPEGTPGSVAGDNGLAGIRIEHTSNIIQLTTGYIGGGKGNNNSIGKATAYINAPYATIQGQFIMANTDVNDHCFFTMVDGTIDNENLADPEDATNIHRRANVNGGALYISDPNGIVNISGGTIRNCSGQLGGAVYMTVGTSSNTSNAQFSISGNAVIGGASLSDCNEASRSGGALYMDAGTFTMTGGTIQFNKAVANDGGGIYIGGGTVNITGGVIRGNQALNGRGGGLFSGDGTIYVGSGAQIGTGGSKSGNGNSAKYGGGIYVDSDVVMTFDRGTIGYNYASEQGGGVYIAQDATLNLQGAAVLTKNHVAAGKQGGGVYLGGTLNVGGSSGTQSMTADDNYAGDESTLSNVHLPAYDKYITLLSDISSSATHIGISVEEGFKPVVQSDTETWLNNIYATFGTSQGRLFDDASTYIVVHTRTNEGLFDPQYIYFIGCWTTEVSADPESQHGNENNQHYYIQNEGGTDETWHIRSNRGLAWFSSYVNGLNNCSAHRSVNAVLEADVDMDGFYWVPIGAIKGYDQTNSSFEEDSVDVHVTFFSGRFDGQGHVIRNLDLGYLAGITRYGLFGEVGTGDQGSALIENVFIDGFTFHQTANVKYKTGGIAGVILGNTVVRNCAARGSIVDHLHDSWSRMGGLVGEMTAPALVHSCYAAPELVGNNLSNYNFGGLVAVIYSGTMSNSFTNVKLGDGIDIYEGLSLGGLTGYNAGVIENCYVRLQGTAPTNFNWFVGNLIEGGSVDYCYAPEGTPEGTNGTYGTTVRDDNGEYAYGHIDQQVDASNDYVMNDGIDNLGNMAGLHATLNNWVDAQNDGVDYARWTRTLASTINDDYPILAMDGFAFAGSSDGITLEYGNDLNTILADYNAATGGGSIYLYGAPSSIVNASNDNDVLLYIGQDAGLLQGGSSTLNARVGVTLDNTSTGFMAYDWHMFSSPLASAPLGLTNSDNTTHAYNYVVPDGVLSISADCYFPQYTPFASMDFYAYYEPDYHWINLKRNSADHWHQDVNAQGLHDQIFYNNESVLYPGKGYLLAIDAPTVLMADGTLTNGPVDYDVTFTDGVLFNGINLVGNPYQGYLDFNELATYSGNSALNFNTYFVLDADAGGYIAYTTDQSSIPATTLWPAELKNYDAPQYIHPHQGFFVHVNAASKLHFTNDMRLAAVPDGSDVHFRGEAPHYPLVGIACTDSDGRNDYATIELGRPEAGGGEKVLRLHAGNASVWFHFDDTDWQTAFTTPGITTAPLRFKAYEDGTFTLRWGTANADFSYLHLIDNLTGIDIDCLTTDSYAFEGKTTDYSSRFKLVFEYTGVEEDGPSTGSGTFAFMMGDEMVVNGEGLLQVFDVNGRCLMSETLHGQQNTIGLPNVSVGVYVLRLTNNQNTQVQKIVVR